MSGAKVDLGFTCSRAGEMLVIHNLSLATKTCFDDGKWLLDGHPPVIVLYNDVKLSASDLDDIFKWLTIPEIELFSVATATRDGDATIVNGWLKTASTVQQRKLLRKLIFLCEQSTKHALCFGTAILTT